MIYFKYNENQEEAQKEANVIVALAEYYKIPIYHNSDIKRNFNLHFEANKVLAYKYGESLEGYRTQEDPDIIGVRLETCKGFKETTTPLEFVQEILKTPIKISLENRVKELENKIEEIKRKFHNSNFNSNLL